MRPEFPNTEWIAVNLKVEIHLPFALEVMLSGPAKRIPATQPWFVKSED